MKNFLGPILAVAILGAIVGFLIGQFAPDLFGGLGTEIKAALTDPFSETRNKIALRYALFGAGIGGILGAVGAAFRRT